MEGTERTNVLNKMKQIHNAIESVDGSVDTGEFPKSTVLQMFSQIHFDI